MSGSGFIEASTAWPHFRFTRGLRPTPERSSPQAVTAELAARCSRLQAALRSRSISCPQVPHVKIRSDSASSALTEPQQEQVLLDGNHRSAIPFALA